MTLDKLTSTTFSKRFPSPPSHTCRYRHIHALESNNNLSHSQSQSSSQTHNEQSPSLSPLLPSPYKLLQKNQPEHKTSSSSSLCTLLTSSSSSSSASPLLLSSSIQVETGDIHTQGNQRGGEGEGWGGKGGEGGEEGRGGRDERLATLLLAAIGIGVLLPLSSAHSHNVYRPAWITCVRA